MKRTVRIGLFVLAAGCAWAQAQETVVPGDNLVVEGIPPIPLELARAADRYTELRSAALRDWHPIRRELLISTRFADTAQLHSVKQPGGARTQLTFFPDRVGAASFHPAGGDYFIFSKDVGGGEWFQLYRYDLASGAITLLTDGASRNVGAVWSSTGDRIAYCSTRRSGKDLDLYVMDPSDPESDRMLLQLEGGGWEALDWSPDDRRILLAEEVSINESYLWLVEAARGEKILVTPRGGAEKVAYSWARFSKDGAGLWVLTDRDSEFQRLAYLDLLSKQHTYQSTDFTWDVEQAALAEDGQTIAFLVNQNGFSKLHWFDTASRRIQAAAGLPDGVLSNLVWHPSGRELGLQVSSARSPSDVYSIEAHSSRVERWTFSETGGLHPATFAEPELVHWTSFDGREISGLLYLPPARFSGKRPVIIDIHGGPESQERPDFKGKDNYFISELGIAIIYPNVRGSSGYGKSFLRLDNGRLREDAYKDIGALLDWIRSRPELDPARILVTGGSYGGHMTLAIATRYDDRICCSVDVVGMSSLVTFLERTKDYRRDLRRVEYGDERDPELRAFLERIAPLAQVDRITKPILIVQGLNDPRVPASESEQMLRVLRRHRTPVGFLMANDEGHGFRNKKNADFQFYATIAFVQRYLLQ